MAFVDFEELTKAAEEQGVPLNLINQWYRTTASDPAVKGKTAAQIAQAIGMAQRAAMTGQVTLPPKADSYQESVDATPQQKFNSGGKVKGYQQGGRIGDEVATTIPQPYQAGAPIMPGGSTDMTLPQEGMGRTAIQAEELARLMADAARQGFRPGEMEAAQAEYRKRAALPGQSAGLLAAGFGGLEVAKRSDENVKTANELLKETTTGAVEKRQEYLQKGLANFTTAQSGQKTANDMYKQGLDAAAKVTDTLVKAKDSNIKESDEVLKQKKAQLELIKVAADADHTKKLQDENSAESKAVRENTRRLLQLTGRYTDAQIKEILEPKGKPIPGWAALPIGVSAGGTVETILKESQAQQARGQAAQAYGLADQARAAAQKERVETAGLVSGQGFNTAQGMPAPDYAAVGAPNITTPVAPPAEVAPGEEPVTRQMPQMTPTVSAEGAVSWAPSSYSLQAGRSASDQFTEHQAQIQNYQQNGGKEATSTVIKMADQFAGPLAAGGRNILNYTNNPDVKNYQLALDRLNGEAAQLGLIASRTSNLGVGAAMGATGAQLASSGAPLAGTAIAATGGLFNGGQPVTATSPARTVKELAIAVKEARAKQAAHLANQAQFAKMRSGDLTGYVNSNAFKDINGRIPMINPKDGEVLLKKPSEMEQALKDGLVRKDTFLGK